MVKQWDDMFLDDKVLAVQQGNIRGKGKCGSDRVGSLAEWSFGVLLGPMQCVKQALQDKKYLFVGLGLTTNTGIHIKSGS